LAADEGTDNIFITDLTQVVFTPGSPGTWTAPAQYIELHDGGYSAGTCGISTAPGSNHLGVVTGEFGGQSYAALQLPSTSGSGTPTLPDWAYVSNLPPVPALGTHSAHTFDAGYDPHTVTAYTSPNDSKSYAVFVDFAVIGAPYDIAVVDLACVLALPRNAGTHNVTNPAVATALCTRFVAVP
jgi:hypothetical protein